MTPSNPLSLALEKQRPLILDGGLATALETAGHDLNHPLWSAKMLLENPAAVSQVHAAFLEAGADIVTSAGYQATFQGLESLGHSELEASRIMLGAVELACKARDMFIDRKDESRLAPMVAASIGPYGAFLADGSEYRGNYGISRLHLRHFHRQRFALLASSGAEMLACETIPSFTEAEVLAQLAFETLAQKTWLSFSCPDGKHISDGTPLADCAMLVEESPGLMALGINCTAPRHISSLIYEAKGAGLTKPLIVYPNSGEKYDPLKKVWTGPADVAQYAEMAEEWLAEGADVIGGCCRVGPKHVSALRERLVENR